MLKPPITLCVSARAEHQMLKRELTGLFLCFQRKAVVEFHKTTRTHFNPFSYITQPDPGRRPRDPLTCCAALGFYLQS